MRRKILGGLLTATMIASGLMMAGIPAIASHDAGGSLHVNADGKGVTGNDPLDDAGFSLNCVDDGQATTVGPVSVPGTGQPVGNCSNNMGMLDVVSYSMKRTDLPGGPALEASWTVREPLPVEEVIGTPISTSGGEQIPGIDFYSYFRVPDLLDNRPTIRCERNTSSAAKKTYIIANAFGDGHTDAWQFFINFGMTYTGGKYVSTPSLGYFVPYDDGGLVFSDVKANSRLARGTHYDWSFSADRKTVTVKIVGQFPAGSSDCKFTLPSIEGTLMTYFARTASQKAADPFYGTTIVSPPPPNSIRTNSGSNDRINDVRFEARFATVVTLPVKVPLSIVPGEEDLEGVGGFVFLVDGQTLSGVDTYDPGQTAKNLGVDTASVKGTGCWTLTFGGTAPVNPLHNYGGPCAIDSPIGDEYFHTDGFNY
ncbi:MAG TPA: hypothetical protein VNA87_05055 [Actinomycetota bacterium]|nr:hypothetical protein [Actinomycetota bacterium]